MNVVITGTDSGLGLQLWTQFTNQPNTTVIGSSRLPAGPQPHLDLSDYENIMDYAHIIKRRMVSIDVLINNAGINGIKRFADLTPEFVERMMRVNCLGPVMLTQALMPVIAAGARIINVISDAAYRPMRHSLAYNCSKAAMDMATKQMARELTKPYNVSVFGVRPGKMRGTEMSAYIDSQVCELRGWTPEQASEYFTASSVTGEEARPAHVASVIRHLATSPLAHNLSGACLDLVG